MANYRRHRVVTARNAGQCACRDRQHTIRKGDTILQLLTLDNRWHWYVDRCIGIQCVRYKITCKPEWVRRRELPAPRRRLATRSGLGIVPRASAVKIINVDGTVTWQKTSLKEARRIVNGGQTNLPRA